MSVAGTQAGKLAAWHGQAAASVVSRCDLARHVAWPRWCADRVRRPGPLTSAALAGADGDGSRLAVARVRGDDQSRAPAGGDAGGEPFGGDAPLERWVHAVRERALPPTGAHFSGPIQGAPGRGRWGDCWKVGMRRASKSSWSATASTRTPRARLMRCSIRSGQGGWSDGLSFAIPRTRQLAEHRRERAERDDASVCERPEIRRRRDVACRNLSIVQRREQPPEGRGLADEGCRRENQAHQHLSQNYVVTERWGD